MTILNSFLEKKPYQFQPDCVEFKIRWNLEMNLNLNFMHLYKTFFKLRKRVKKETR